MSHGKMLEYFLQLTGNFAHVTVANLIKDITAIKAKEMKLRC